MGQEGDVHLVSGGQGGPVVRPGGAVRAEHHHLVRVLVVDPQQALAGVRRPLREGEEGQEVAVVAGLQGLQAGRLLVQVEGRHPGEEGVAPAQDAVVDVARGEGDLVRDVQRDGLEGEGGGGLRGGRRRHALRPAGGAGADGPGAQHHPRLDRPPAAEAALQHVPEEVARPVLGAPVVRGELPVVVLLQIPRRLVHLRLVSTFSTRGSSMASPFATPRTPHRRAVGAPAHSEGPGRVDTARNPDVNGRDRRVNRPATRPPGEAAGERGGRRRDAG